MLLSEYYCNGTIINEKEFYYLGILDSKLKDPTLSYIEDAKYISSIKENVTMLLTTKDVYNLLKNMDLNCGFCICDEPRITFFRLHNKLVSIDEYKRECFDTKIGENCEISPLALICPRNVVIGNHVIIEEFVSIKENTVIGDNTIIRAGSVIGSEGFEFKKDGDTRFRVKHLGGVIVGEHVEIQYNCCVDKAIFPWDNTIIGKYTKFDNLIHIGHASKLGERVLLPAGTTVSGRVEIDDDVWIGVSSVISNGITFGKNSRCNIGSVVTKNVPENGNVTGNFAIDHHKFINNLKKNR